MADAARRSREVGHHDPAVLAAFDPLDGAQQNRTVVPPAGCVELRRQDRDALPASRGPCADRIGLLVRRVEAIARPAPDVAHSNVAGPGGHGGHYTDL